MPYRKDNVTADISKRVEVEGTKLTKEDFSMDQNVDHYAYIGELALDQYEKLCGLIGDTVNILAMGVVNEGDLYIVVDTRDTDDETIGILQRFVGLIGD